jgi:hypothetical protein
MKKIFRFLMFLCVAVVVFTSCHKSVPKQTLYIPKDATFVLGADPKSLSGKLADSHIDMDSLFKTFADTSSASHVGIKSWDDLKNSGLDWESEFFVFISTSGSIMNGQTTSTGVIAAMKDQTAFETFLKKQYAQTDIKKENNYSYAVLEDGFVVGWNGDVAVLSNVIATNHSDDSGATPPDASIASQKQLDALFAQKENESIASTSQFTDLVKQKADMLFWSNSTNALASIPFLGMTKAADLLKDSYSAGTVDFENGKATLSSKYYAGKDLSDILSKYSGPVVDMNMVNQYPSPVNGYTVFSFNPQIIAAIAKYVGVDATANQFLQQMGLSLDDILKAFKGDFAIIFSDLGMISKPNEFSPGDSTKSFSAKLIVNAAIGDKKSYDKIVAAFASKGQMVLQNGQYVFPQMNGYAMSTDDKNLIVASDAGLLQQYKSGSSGKANIPSDIADQSKNSSFTFYVDIESLLKSIPADSPESIATIDDAEQTFKNGIATGSNFDGTSLNTVFQLNTVNDKENSLVSIIKFATAAAKENKAKQAREDAQQSMAPAIDTTEAMPSK